MKPYRELRVSELWAALRDLVMRMEAWEELVELINKDRRRTVWMSERRLEAAFDVTITALYDAVRKYEAIKDDHGRLIEARIALDKAERIAAGRDKAEDSQPRE